MAKNIKGFIKLQVAAGAATPAPPVGPALGQRGLNIQDFCKAFNAITEKEEKGTPLPVVITCYEDRTFSFVVKKPPTSVLIRKALGIGKGSSKPHMDKVGQLTQAAAEEIATTKMQDMNTKDLAAAVLQVKGTARSMGVEVEH